MLSDTKCESLKFAQNNKNKNYYFKKSFFMREITSKFRYLIK